MQDDDVTNTKGIYTYVLTRKEKHLVPSATTISEIEEMEADHIKPWHADGKTDAENCQMLCRECNRRKSGK